MTKAATTALRALREAIAEVSEAAPHDGHIPQDVTVVAVDRWRDCAHRKGISPGGAERAQRAAFQRGSEYLIGAGHAAVWEPRAWTT